VLPASHPLCGRPSIGLADLRETPFVLFESGFALHRIIQDACARAGFEPHVVAYSSQIHLTIELVGACLGVTFLPRMTATERHTIRVCQVLLEEPGTAWDMAMAWRRGAYLSGAAQAWLDLVRDVHGFRRP
jgi:DNA-binding transcriptional LysR family regulator